MNRRENRMLKEECKGMKACSTHTLTHKELAILNAKPSDEPDRAKIKWRKTKKWKRKRGERQFTPKHSHPGTKEAREVLKALDYDLTVCQACGLKSNKLSVHHVNHNPYNNEPSNLLLLCKNCHANSHHIADMTGIKEWYYGTKPDYSVEEVETIHGTVVKIKE